MFQRRGLLRRARDGRGRFIDGIGQPVRVGGRSTGGKRLGAAFDLSNPRLERRRKVYPTFATPVMDVIVTVGFNMNEARDSPVRYPKVKFIGVDQFYVAEDNGPRR